MQLCGFQCSGGFGVVAVISEHHSRAQTSGCPLIKLLQGKTQTSHFCHLRSLIPGVFLWVVVEDYAVLHIPGKDSEPV